MSGESNCWGTYTVAPGEVRRWRVGPLTLWIQRLEGEWRVAYLSPDDPEASATEAAVVDDRGLDLLDQEHVQRFAVAGARGEISLAPALADRPVVARPERPFCLPAGAEAVVYVSSPLWVVLSTAQDVQLMEIPLARPSDTWFGPSTREGELLMVALANDMEVKMDALTSVFMFEELTLAQLSRILNACEVQSHDTGAVLLAEGEPCSRLLINLDGTLKVSRGDDTTAELEAGDHLGATTLLYPRQSRATVRATSPTRVLALEREDFLALAQERPWLGVALLQRLGRRLSRDLDRALEGTASRKGNGIGEAFEPAELF